MQRLSQLTAKDFPQQAGEHAQMCTCFRHLWRIISSTEGCAKNRAYLPPLVGESVLPNGVTFCYPIPAAPLVFHDPGTEKAAATQSDNGLMYPAGLEFNDTIYARDCVYKFMSGSYFAPSGSFTHPSLSVSPSRRCVHRRWSPCGATARPPAHRSP